MLRPSCPIGQDLFFSAFGVTLVMDVKQKVNERVRVVHPAQVENDSGVVAAEPKGARLDDRGDKNSECSDEDGSGDRAALLGAVPSRARNSGSERGKKVEMAMPASTR
jgi:hypothetical protein